MSQKNKPMRPATAKPNTARRFYKKSDTGNIQKGLLSIFPPRLRTVLPYSDQFNLTGATLSAVYGTERAFRLNSMFDPDFTSTGHQPFGYDQITPFYARYLVDKVEVDITFSDPQGDGLYVGVFAKNFNDPATLTGASISQAMERPTVFQAPLNNTGSQTVKFRRIFKIHELMGLTKQQYESAWSQTSALVSANPSVVPYLSMAVADANASSPALVCKATIELKMHCVFFDRLMPAQS